MFKIMENCLVTKLKGSVANSDLPVFCSVKVRLFNTSGSVNTKSMVSISPYNSSVKINVVDGSVNVYTFDNVNFTPVATEVTGEYEYTGSQRIFIQGNATVWIGGKYNNVNVGNNYSEQVIANSDYSQLDFDTFNYAKNLSLYQEFAPKGTLKLSTVEGINYLNINLINGDYCYDFSDCTKELFSVDSNIIVTNGGVSYTNIIKNLNIEILENATLMETVYMPLQSSVSGSINTLCDRLYANGKHSGRIIFSLNGTQCTYNNEVITIDYPGWAIRATFTESGWTGEVLA
jgi:hypothetical protein